MAQTQYNVFCRYFNEVISKSVTNNPNVTWMSAKEWRSYDTEEMEARITFIEATIKSEKEAIDREAAAKVQQLQNRYESLKPQVWYNWNLVWDGTITPEMKDIVNNQIPQVEKDAILKKSDVDAKYKNEYEDLKTLRNKYVEARNHYTKRYESGTASREEIVKIRPMVPFNIDEDTAFYQDVLDESSTDNPKFDFMFVYDGICVYNPKEVGTAQHGLELIYDQMQRIYQSPWFLYSVHSSLASALEKTQTLVDLFGLQNVRVGKVVALDQYIDIY